MTPTLPPRRLATFAVACPLCGQMIECGVTTTGETRRAADHIEVLLAADTSPLDAHIATHRHPSQATAEPAPPEPLAVTARLGESPRPLPADWDSADRSANHDGGWSTRLVTGQ